MCLLWFCIFASLSQSGGKIKVPPKSVIDGLASASSGDIRGAINALQFACLKGKYFFFGAFFKDIYDEK